MPKSNVQRILDSALVDLSILAGESMGPSDVSWQDVAGTAASNLRALANILDEARQGGAFPEMPSVEEAWEEVNGAFDHGAEKDAVRYWPDDSELSPTWREAVTEIDRIHRRDAEADRG